MISNVSDAPGSSQFTEHLERTEPPSALCWRSGRGLNCRSREVEGQAGGCALWCLGSLVQRWGPVARSRGPWAQLSLC